eukprot:2051340-Amphidinium_carterae.1
MKTVLRKSVVSPDVDRSGRRIPSEIAHSLFYILLRMAGLDRARVLAIDNIMWGQDAEARLQPVSRTEATAGGMKDWEYNLVIQIHSDESGLCGRNRGWVGG